jgi:hypothetical protein
MRRAVRAHRADFVHARGYVPAFLAQRLGVPFLFDMRGFWPDERADGGLWSRGSFGYRLWKRIETSLLADEVMAQRAESLGSPSAPYQILEAHRQLKQFDEAERTLAKLCPAKEAGTPGCKLERMSVLAATGHLAEARAIVAELVAANKQRVRIYAGRAGTYANISTIFPRQPATCAWRSRATAGIS